MEKVSLKDYLTSDDYDEITEKLIQLDYSIKNLHENGFFVVSFDANNITLYDNQITFASFNDKLDYLNSGFNDDGAMWDILEMCSVGICAYNKFSQFYVNKDFINQLRTNLDFYNQNKRIPEEIYGYYKSVLIDGNIDYLTNYLENKYKKDGNSTNNSRVYTKSTAIGKALKDKNNEAFISVLIIPSIMVLTYIIFIVIAMVIR